MLCLALKANKSDRQIKELLLECKQKGFKARYLTGKVRKEVDDAAAARIKRLM
jgi:HKD family nuclease